MHSQEIFKQGQCLNVTWSLIGVGEIATEMALKLEISCSTYELNLLTYAGICEQVNYFMFPNFSTFC